MQFTLLRRNKDHTILAWNCFQYIYRSKLGPYSEAKQLCECCRAILCLAPRLQAMEESLGGAEQQQSEAENWGRV